MFRNSGSINSDLRSEFLKKLPIIIDPRGKKPGKGAQSTINSGCGPQNGGCVTKEESGLNQSSEASQTSPKDSNIKSPISSQLSNGKTINPNSQTIYI